MSNTEPKSQADRIITKFGGAAVLCKALERAGCPRHISTLYYWNLPKAKGGTGGKVPSSSIDDVKAAAVAWGVLLTAEDWAP